MMYFSNEGEYIMNVYKSIRKNLANPTWGGMVKETSRHFRKWDSERPIHIGKSAPLLQSSEKCKLTSQCNATPYPLE